MCAVGVHVDESAAATLDDCQISDCVYTCLDVQDSTCRITNCTLSDSHTGICVKGAGSRAHASTCHLLRNSYHGAKVWQSATLEVFSARVLATCALDLLSKIATACLS